MADKWPKPDAGAHVLSNRNVGGGGRIIMRTNEQETI